jgi:hypothetical protein
MQASTSGKPVRPSFQAETQLVGLFRPNTVEARIQVTEFHPAFRFKFLHGNDFAKTGG